MTPTPNHLLNERDDYDDGRAPERPRGRLHRRSSDKLLTLDRALLIGIFGIGMTWGVNQFKQGTLETRVEALERVNTAQGDKEAVHDTELAVIKERLDNIQNGVRELAVSMTRFVNTVPDRRTDR